MLNFAKSQMVLFADGCSAMTQVFVYGGACLAGDPTAYVLRHGRMVWVKPGDSVEWVEAVAEPAFDWNKMANRAASIPSLCGC